MKKAAGIIVVATCVAAVLGIQEDAKPEPREDTGAAARGRYLVHHVAMCVQCHTPRTRRGTLIRERLLQGAPVPVRPPWAGERWAARAPDISRVTDPMEGHLLRLLTEGVGRDGRAPRPPMPPFRMSEEDARAVVAYLRSLR